MAEEREQLSTEELEQQAAEDLPDREAMSIISPSATMPIAGGVVAPDPMPVNPASGGQGMLPPWDQ